MEHVNALAFGVFGACFLGLVALAIAPLSTLATVALTVFFGPIGFALGFVSWLYNAALRCTEYSTQSRNERYSKASPAERLEMEVRGEAPWQQRF